MGARIAIGRPFCRRQQNGFATFVALRLRAGAWDCLFMRLPSSRGAGRLLRGNGPRHSIEAAPHGPETSSRGSGPLRAPCRGRTQVGASARVTRAVSDCVGLCSTRTRAIVDAERMKINAQTIYRGGGDRSPRARAAEARGKLGLTDAARAMKVSRGALEWASNAAQDAPEWHHVSARESLDREHYRCGTAWMLLSLVVRAELPSAKMMDAALRYVPLDRSESAKLQRHSAWGGWQ